MIDLENGVLLHDAEEHQQAQRGVEVDRLVGRQQRDKRERHRQRQREQDGERVNEALELGGEDDVHQDHRQREREQEFPESGFQLAGAAGDARRVAGRQAHFRHLARNAAMRSAWA